MVGILFFLIFYCTTLFGSTLPKEAQAILDSLPENALTLEVVVSGAIKSSESFRALRAFDLSSSASHLQAGAPFDPKLTAKIGWQDDKREPLSPFQPNRSQGSQYSLGVSTFFPTGTLLSLDLSHNISDLNFPTLGPLLNSESRTSLSIHQSLWQDAFGWGSRAMSAASLEMGRLAQISKWESTEEWFLGIGQLFYSAWLSQEKARTAKESLYRRERLLKIVQQKLKRGTAEPPDLLQVQSAEALSQVQVSEAEFDIQERWRTLIVLLKFPEQWKKIDPLLIPMTLDNPVDRARSACGTEDHVKNAPAETTLTKRHTVQQQVAKLNVEKAESDEHPDLKLSVAAGTNGVAPNSSATLSETIRAEHPIFGASLTFTWPLGLRAENAKLHTFRAEEIRAESNLNITRDHLKNDWENRCRELFQMERALFLHRETHLKQSQRSKLEEERFQIGRTHTFQVTQAEDDAAQAKLGLKTTEVRIRQTAWRVLQMTGELQRYVEKLGAVEK